MNVALIGGVSSSLACLHALVRGGVEITGVLGLDESRADAVSDYRSLGAEAKQADLPFRSFTSITEPAVETFLRDRQPDLLWVIGLSQLVPERVIRIARHGGVGFHPTMLPRGRGRAPVAWTILLGEPAAVSLFYLTKEPDAGDLIAQQEVPVLPDDYSTDLIARTNDVLADVVLRISPMIRENRLPRTPQDPSLVTYHPKRTPKDGLIEWAHSTDQIYRLVRAAGRPYPGAYTHDGNRRISVWRARPADGSDVRSTAEPGTIVGLDHHRGALALTGTGGIWLTEIGVGDGNDAAVFRMDRMHEALANGTTLR